MEDLKKVRLWVCASRGGWHRRTPAEVAECWSMMTADQKKAAKARLAKLSDEDRQALEARLAEVKGWGEPPEPPEAGETLETLDHPKGSESSKTHENVDESKSGGPGNLETPEDGGEGGGKK